MKLKVNEEQETFKFSKFNQDFIGFKFGVKKILQSKEIKIIKTNRGPIEETKKAADLHCKEVYLKIPSDFKEMEKMIREEVKMEENVDHINTSRIKDDIIDEMNFFVEKKNVFQNKKGKLIYKFIKKKILKEKINNKTVI